MTMSNKPFVIYHANCFDGFTAAWICRRFLGECDFHPAIYGEQPPLVQVIGREAYIVDFSYPRDAMLDILVKSSRFTVLDHHKTAKEALDGLFEEVLAKSGGSWGRPHDEIVFDMERSGAGIAWDYLSKGANRHWLVDYIEDRDLWRQTLPRTREVSAYIASLPMTFEEWDALAAERWQDIADKGAAIQRYIDTYGVKAREQARWEYIGDDRVPTINLPYMNCAEHVGALVEQYPEAEFAAGYFRRADGRWQFSLRSRPDGADVSVVAKQFGGGGHRGAAGFDVEFLPWERM